MQQWEVVRLSGVVLVDADSWYWLQATSAAAPAPAGALLPALPPAGCESGVSCGEHCWYTDPGFLTSRAILFSHHVQRRLYSRLRVF